VPITPAVATAINAQIGRELGAHLQYLAIASHFDAEGLPELAAFFDAQAQEEHDHAMKFLAYLREAGGEVALHGVEAPRGHFENAEEAVALSLAWEEEVTRQIDALVDVAIANRDHAAQTFLQWFVTEQVEEVSTMDELLRVVRRAGESGLLFVEDYVVRKMAAEAAAGE
jgi:bacterioferritin B